MGTEMCVLTRLGTAAFIAVLPNARNYVSPYPSQLLRKLPRSPITLVFLRLASKYIRYTSYPTMTEGTDKKEGSLFRGAESNLLSNDVGTIFWVKPLSTEAKCLSICFKIFYM